MRSRILRSCLLALLLIAPALARDPLRGPPNGPAREDPGWHALVGATVHRRAESKPEKLNVVLRGGEIVSVSDAPPPAGARVWDLTGHHIYPGFIDAYVEVDAPSAPEGAPGEHWNPLVRPGRSALDGPGLPEETARELRELGFTAAAISPKGGIFRGTAALVSLAEPDPDAGPGPAKVYEPRIYHAVGFDTARGEEGGYPDSLMGAIAVVRQTLADATWLQGSLSPLRALTTDAPQRLLFDAGDELNVLRAAGLRRPDVILGAGTEFRRLDAVVSTGKPLVVPLRFPRKPDVASIGAMEAVTLRELMTWEQAPTNPRRLAERGALVALTTSRLEKPEKFGKNLRKALRHGLSEESALAMLTGNPAKVLEVADSMGSIDEGRVANLQVTDGPVFEEHSRLRWLFIDGRPHEIRPASLAGRWEVTLEPPMPDSAALVFDHDDKVKVHSEGEVADGEAKIEGARISVTFDHQPFGEPGVFVLSGTREGEVIRGDGRRSDGKAFRWTARRVSREVPKDKHEEPEVDRAADVPEEYGTPFGAYGVAAPPAPPDLVVIRGATLWTCGPKGVIEKGDFAALDGEIFWVETEGEAHDLEEAVAEYRASHGADSVRVIDGEGLHVTPGIIDCHSHTGVSGSVNESGQAVTAEVRIEDVLDPDDVNLYRQLAGGVTTINILHGSANPIGGQTCVIKLRWGVARPEELLFEEAPRGIKFALGENVKQSNWGERHNTRYPQTRMGVETLIRDRFLAAREYAAGWEHYEAHWLYEHLGPPRKDFELQALAEVLSGERLLHCHSYRQDEILMLCRVAEEFGFKIGTFQHVLEGYKVAEAIRAHSLGGSCFSDWWAYKVEVQDAIPQNGPIMREAGGIVSYNSDSSELARRLNVEAAKAMKYGGLSPEEALLFITLNPAKQLKIEDLVGSLTDGKQADFAIWSGPPLSVTSRCLGTWIEGREYFSIEKDREHRERIRAERQRLIQKVLRTKEEGDWEEKGKDEKDYRCCDVEGGGR